MTVSRVGVIGAGQMGNGIAHVMALAGYNVVLNDIDQMALDKSVEIIEKNMMRQLRGGENHRRGVANGAFAYHPDDRDCSGGR